MHGSDLLGATRCLWIAENLVVGRSAVLCRKELQSCWRVNVLWERTDWNWRKKVVGLLFYVNKVPVRCIYRDVQYFAG